MYQPVNFRAIILATTLIASPAAAEPFTYQGQIQDAGAPANGTYDFRFQLFDAPAGGSQIGPTLTFDDIVVTDGLFQVDPDFGDVFNQDDAFIFIQVREGTSTGGYTGLLPRTPVNATPKAQHATTADTVLNPQWTEAPGVLSYGTGADRVLINRSSEITAGEYFGVYGDTSNFAGMFVSGPAGSLPFYAYSIDGGINAYTYVDAANNWNLNINDSLIALRVDAQGNAFTAADIQTGGQFIQSYAPGSIDLATPIAYGFVNATGNVNAGTPNVSSVWNAALSRYEIEIDNEDYFFNQYVTIVSPTFSNLAPRVSSSSGRILVFMQSTINQDDIQASFQFVTYKPNGAAFVQGQRRPPLQPLNAPADDVLYPNLAPPSPRPFQPEPMPNSPRQRD